MAGISITPLVRALPLLALAYLTLMAVSSTAASPGRACAGLPSSSGTTITTTATAGATGATGEWLGLKDGAVATWRQAQEAGARAEQAYYAVSSVGCLFEDIDVTTSRGRW